MGSISVDNVQVFLNGLRTEIWTNNVSMELLVQNRIIPYIIDISVGVVICVSYCFTANYSRKFQNL
ncbi:unnamed protein product [Brugia timori]|uniref:Neur_chan_LBD domain-containing protein n=1 Tax=Brugia timori TaxID=42155 RepID=A0A0R3QH50_9BILA|nr:unnamed protein product [Brugia timori]